jgi:hypothetical protein
MVLYPILLAWFTAPSKFLPHDNGYEAKRYGPRISTQVLPLELPKNGDELAGTLRFGDTTLHDAQVKLFRRAQAWDNVFIEIYVLQFAAMALLVAPAGSMLLLQALAVGSIVVAGIFDHLENLRIDQILNSSGPPFEGLIAAVTLVSKVKWVAIFVAFLLLADLLWSHLPAAPAFRTALVAALVVASLVGFAGILFAVRALLSWAMVFYGLVPLLILWRYVLSPPVRAIDGQLRAAAERETRTMEQSGMAVRFDKRLVSDAPKWSLDDLERRI